MTTNQILFGVSLAVAVTQYDAGLALELDFLSWRLAAALRIGAGGATQMTPVPAHQLLPAPASVVFWDRAA